MPRTISPLDLSSILDRTVIIDACKDEARIDSCLAMICHAVAERPSGDGVDGAVPAGGIAAWRDEGDAGEPTGRER